MQVKVVVVADLVKKKKKFDLSGLFWRTVGVASDHSAQVTLRLSPLSP